MPNTDKEHPEKKDPPKGPIPVKNKPIQEKKYQGNPKKDFNKNTHAKKKNSNRGDGGANKTHGRRSQRMNEMGSNFDLSIEEEISSGNFKLKGRKTQVSINHLLDFQLPDVERRNEMNRRTNNRSRRGHNNEQQHHVHLHGDSFINVNYRLLVDDKFDYKEQSNNPNSLVPDDKIVRVVVPKGQNCPICLTDDPVAPRMVTCGHVFCASCLLHFFSIEETIKNPETGYVKKRKYKECPLCSSIIRLEKVKPVLFENNSVFQENEKKPEPGMKVTFDLMCKPRSSMLPLPVRLRVDPLQTGDFPSYDLKEIIPYARIIKCNPQHAVKFYQDDLESINQQYDIDRALYNDDNQYVKKVLEDIDSKIIVALTEDETVGTTMDSSVLSDFSNLKLETELLKNYDDSVAFFFYQTFFQSPTKYFLSPLDIKLLLACFQNYSKFPETMTVAIENIHYGSIVTEQFIQRYKYVGHLPIGTEIALIDIDWRNVPFIPKEIYNQFAIELKQRRRKSNMKKQREDKDKKIYEQEIERQQAEFYRKENNDISYHEMMDSFSSIRNSPGLLDSLTNTPHRSPSTTAASTSNATTTSVNEKSKKSYKEKTIWGTSISVIPDERTSKENEEFEKMLLSRMNKEKSEENVSSPADIESLESSGKKKKNNKRKGKIMLFSNNHQTF
ncbi:RING-type E3 ubiquitin transferase MAG2 NDAI_0J02500 [Naumovozyma dairenensis CBS 421]|uniref:RING-type domain-containing protein n=1 Tax=Naumovozyma dairenensis (strain ATCC 10597 / BCRC 20456 / CBS 421 / NBRC 0211 / NRRL Y-12639) TaxID=1071378 RepID=G0WH64_NAUDC|nr:hypothetical protein NDAI_0J02500 [Naumovozyma dairenensis CBS 421]CCD27142.1 hypothetical protein NDAI_0J02500 [Naumovozyma dairenensis CBS 421]